MALSKREGLELALALFTKTSESLDRVNEVAGTVAMALGSFQGLLDAGIESIQEELKDAVDASQQDAPVWDTPISWDEDYAQYEADRTAKIDYITSMMTKFRGNPGVWEDTSFTSRLSDNDLDRAYKFVQHYANQDSGDKN